MYVCVYFFDIGKLLQFLSLCQKELREKKIYFFYSLRGSNL